MLTKKLKLNSSKSKFFFVTIEDFKFLVLDLPSYKKMYISCLFLFLKKKAFNFKLKKKNREEDFENMLNFYKMA